MSDVIRMMQTELSSAESRCLLRMQAVRRHLKDMDSALDDPSYRLTVSTAEGVRAMAEAFSSLQQVAALRLAVALMSMDSEGATNG